MEKELKEEKIPQPVQPAQQVQPTARNLKSLIDKVTTLTVFVCIICLGLWIYNGFVLPYLVLAIILFFLANCINSIQVVQKPEIWIIERLGKFNRKLEPGVHWVIPWIEGIRAKIKVRDEQYLPMFDSEKAIVFRDGPAKLKDPKVYIQLDKDHLENAFYGLTDWRLWVKEVLEPIVRGYLNTLSIIEALDEGAARGDILQRLKERPEATKTQIERLDKQFEEVRVKIEEYKKKHNNNEPPLLESLKGAIEKERTEAKDRKKNQEDLKTELEKFEELATKERGFKKIIRVAVGEFEISDELEKARQSVQEAQKEAEASVYKAIEEATMRVNPVVATQEKLKGIGFTQKEARDNALLLEIVETLAKNRSLFLTNVGKGGDMQSLVAQLTAIFTEVKQAREEIPKDSEETPKAGKKNKKT